jgi:hypothetical protein
MIFLEATLFSKERGIKKPGKPTVVAKAVAFCPLFVWYCNADVLLVKPEPL